MAQTNPRFPIYIPSKGRADRALTPAALDTMGVPYHIIVERQELSAYARRYPRDRLLVLPGEKYRAEHETGDDLGDSISHGASPARNFAWDHAMAEGHEWHWCMDDNIGWFVRLNGNQRIRVGDGMVLKQMEDFTLRYENVGMAGPQYSKFAPSRLPHRQPYSLNTRIFSCQLIRNDTGLRWRGRMNEDLTLSIDMLKAGWCTILFAAFLQEKVTTQKIPGGYVGEFYGHEGTLQKSQIGVRFHPDVVRMVRKYGHTDKRLRRWHHEADFSQWSDMGLIRKPDWQPGSGPYKTTRRRNPGFRKPVNPGGK